jgi:hypothetical protein
MGTFFKLTLPLLLIASAMSAIAGYAFGLHSVRRDSIRSERAIVAVPAAEGATSDVLVPPPSWTRWPRLTDF